MKHNGNTLGRNTFLAANYVFLSLLSLSFIIPFLIMISTSLVSEAELIRRGNFILIPEQISFAAYEAMLGKGSALYNAYGVTILRTVLGTFLNLVMTSMMAYGLSNRQVPGRNAIITLVFVTMLIEGGLIPTYLLIKGLHLLDTFWVMVIPGLISAWNLIIMRNFFMQIPEVLQESATIDGATPLGILVKVVLPLSMPTIATIGLFYAVGHWNAWFDATIYINDMNLQPLQVMLRQIVLTASPDELKLMVTPGFADRPTPQSLKAAAIMLTTLPILFVYPFLQKHFVKGVLVGSIKG